MAIYDIHWQAPLVVGTSVDAGWAVLPKPDGEWVVATSANRALYGRTAGVVLVGASSESPAPVAVTGIVDKGVAGLGTGSASWVRVTADGALERCTPSGSDDIVGYCRADGTLHLMCNFFTAAMINATGPAIPTGTGFRHISSGSEDAAAAKVNLTSSADVTVPASGVVKSNGAVLSSSNVNLTSEVTGTLPVASGGTGLTAVGTAYQLLRTNAGATAIEWGATNLASSNAVTGALPYTNGGTGLTALGSPLQVLRTNAGATAVEWATVSGGATITGTDGEVVTKSGSNGVTATRVRAGSEYISIATAAGVGAATAGNIRFDNSQGEIAMRNDANTDNIFIISANSNSLEIGEADMESIAYKVKAGHAHRFWVDASTVLQMSSTNIQVETATLTVSNTTIGSGYVQIGASAAASGAARLADAGQVNWKNGGSTVTALEVNAGVAYIGTNSSYASQASTIREYAGTDGYLGVGTTNYLYWGGGSVRLGKPLIGLSSPYALDGAVGITITGNHTLTDSQYIYRYIIFGTSGSEGGAATMTFPNPSSDTYGYGKWIINNSVATLTIECGAGSVTCTIAAGRVAHVLFLVDATFDLTAAHTFP